MNENFYGNIKFWIGEKCHTVLHQKIQLKIYKTSTILNSLFEIFSIDNLFALYRMTCGKYLVSFRNSGSFQDRICKGPVQIWDSNAWSKSNININIRGLSKVSILTDSVWPSLALWFYATYTRFYISSKWICYHAFYRENVSF